MYSAKQCGTAEHHYQAVRIDVFEPGDYRFLSERGIPMLGFLYHTTFDPSNPTDNLIAIDDTDCASKQFHLRLSLEKNLPYILVVTTEKPAMTGAFSIVAIGAANVSFTRLDTPSLVQSIYSSILSEDSPTFTDDHCKTASRYYEALRINVPQPGRYKFLGDSSAQVHGFIYANNFHPLESFVNLIAMGEDDRCVDNNKFQLDLFLPTNITYILVVTTAESTFISRFSMIMMGLANISLTEAGESLSEFNASVSIEACSLFQTLRQSCNRSTPRF